MDSIGSTVINVARLSISWKSSMTQSFQIPLVYMATGQEMCMLKLLASSSYLAILFALPGSPLSCLFLQQRTCHYYDFTAEFSTSFQF